MTKQELEIFINNLIGIETEMELDKSCNCDDGGTCNFDTTIVKLGRISKKTLFGVACCRLTTKGNGWFYIESNYDGQGFRRTRRAEYIAKRLKDLGYDTSVWYCID